MGYNAMEDLKEMICKELDEIAEKGEMSAGDLDTVYKLVVTKEKLLRIDEIEENMGGYSRDGDWGATGSYSRGNYSRGRYYRDDGMQHDSYANRGMHYVRGHYSREEGREKVVDRIREMMNDESLSNNDRNVLRKAMEQMQK